MSRIVVVGPDQMPDWLEKRRKVFGELDRQLIQGLQEPGKGLALEQLQDVVEHRNPFDKAAPVKPRVEIVPPTNGRIYEVRVRVDYVRPWHEAVLAAGPNTPKHHDVFKVGGSYPAEPKSRRSARLVKVVLANFGPGSVTQSVTALEWGRGQHLRPAISRECFAVGEHRPNLNRDLGLKYMAAVSLVTCSFEGEPRVPRVWWLGSERYSDLGWFTGDWDEFYWFAFVRE